MDLFSKIFGNNSKQDSEQPSLSDDNKKMVGKSYVLKMGALFEKELSATGLQIVSTHNKARKSRDGGLPESMLLCFKEKSGNMATIEIFKDHSEYTQVADRNTISGTPAQILVQVKNKNSLPRPSAHIS